MTREQLIFMIESSQKALRRFLTALCCGDSALADDIAQESFIRAYLALEDVNNAENFNPWIFRIAYNTFLNHKRSVKPTVGYDTAGEMASDYRTDNAFKYQELYSALEQLPDKERTSILLFYLQGYSIKEIADITENSQDAVKQHLSRGRSHLRSLLKSI